MPSRPPLAQVSDVETLWRPLRSDDERRKIADLIVKASAKLRHAAPWDIDARMTLDPTSDMFLERDVVADRVATIIARFLRNPDGVASQSQGVGPYSRSQTYVNRYDKTGADVRGELRVVEEDIDELRPVERTRGPRRVQMRPTRQMNPVSQWNWDRGSYINPVTGLPDASYEPEFGYDPNSYDPSYDPDPTDDRLPQP